MISWCYCKRLSTSYSSNRLDRDLSELCESKGVDMSFLWHSFTPKLRPLDASGMPSKVGKSRIRTFGGPSTHSRRENSAIHYYSFIWYVPEFHAVHARASEDSNSDKIFHWLCVHRFRFLARNKISWMVLLGTSTASLGKTLAKVKIHTTEGIR